MTQQFDEGVKEILMTLLSLGATMYEADYIDKQLFKRPEPVEQKIEALKLAADKIDSPKFDRVAGEVEQRLAQDEQKPILVKPRINPLEYIDTATKLIISSEIHGGNISDPINKKYLSPYKDDKGLWTVGIGHLIGDGSDDSKSKWVEKNSNKLTSAQAIALFKKDLMKHAAHARNVIGPDVFDKLSTNRKAALVDIAYRGDLKPGHDFVKLLQQSKFKQAADSYLDHREYKERLSQGGKDGVVKRMNRNASIIRGTV